MSVVSGSRARWAVLAVLLAVVLGPAAGADETSPSSPTATAWHPSGVGELTAPTYAEGTLHVGAALGQETDRTYLRFELGSVPDDADVEALRARDLSAGLRWRRAVREALSSAFTRGYVVRDVTRDGYYVLGVPG